MRYDSMYPYRTDISILIIFLSITRVNVIFLLKIITEQWGNYNRISWLSSQALCQQHITTNQLCRQTSLSFSPVYNTRLYGRKKKKTIRPKLFWPFSKLFRRYIQHRDVFFSPARFMMARHKRWRFAAPTFRKWHQENKTTATTAKKRLMFSFRRVATDSRPTKASVHAVRGQAYTLVGINTKNFSQKQRSVFSDN